MDFSIKKITKKDIPKIVEIVSRVLTDDFDIYPLKVREAYKKVFNEKYFKDLLKNKKNVFFGAYKNNELIGFFSLKSDYGGIIYGDWLAVKKEYRSHGMASSLLKKAEEWMIKNKYHAYYLFTETEKNTSFYKKRGFKHIGTFKKSWFGQDEKIMQKILRAEPFKEIFN
ncbi:hypothetical protein COS31_03190 [Candidatus Roizmanbacteria bacterium CG02_land_8_20_14_3_00_36_15]|uniref:N-acetyltransferase domain-containing protein n=2 Tax=Candidatus Roizmaniibacteriota TaxID=1752723 RepID=A0A2M8KLJ3_9BACT|nr:MAG: hypothetical protein COS51_03600 [Candidatus Roizmanbacteria bacterium CG03_land_8_20_14_0_80_36_21]PIV37682.1 MAG: hypothetical protein COS31_03190 [Candidatus Roizmanbacteria bacterium CG02_land_8_20_14_3_00_36_15]PIY69639.1 MAG: hypothetical protein COY89_05195 [Candidatus Roizmanbacteria bacterium CG_4_10_14_0_8_um_filter_36_36]PJA53511.1 MAG: hypothetical protein CO166_01400 [Candidatus Roizmanbacteria bacterium CG_4_9_14_3_um_filter_36_11]PJC82149.1 MAG: hypothetical protein CO007